MKLLSRRRNYSDANPILSYCDNPSPDYALRCADELGHLGWCINGDTLWRDEVWNVDHWANTEEAPPVDPEPTMSATEWVRLGSVAAAELGPAEDNRDPVLIAMDQHRSMHAQRVEDARQTLLQKEVKGLLMKPKPTPQNTNDRDPLSAAWRRGYHRDRNRTATLTPHPSAKHPAVKPRYMPGGLRTMPAPDGIGTRILNTPMPTLLPVGKTLPDGWLWWAAAAVIFLPSLIGLQISTNSPEERPAAAASPTTAPALPFGRSAESSRPTRRFGEVKEKEPYSSAWGVGPYGPRYDSETECENMIVISKRWVVGFDPNSVCRVEKGVTYGPTAPPWVIVP